MAYTLADLQAVEDAIASGELRVRYGDKEVTYRSISELLQARRVIKADLQAQGLLPPPGNRISKLRSSGKGI